MKRTLLILAALVAAPAQADVIQWQWVTHNMSSGLAAIQVRCERVIPPATEPEIIQADIIGEYEFLNSFATWLDATQKGSTIAFLEEISRTNPDIGPLSLGHLHNILNVCGLSQAP